MFCELIWNVCSTTLLWQHWDQVPHHAPSTPTEETPAQQLAVGSQPPSSYPASPHLSLGSQPEQGPEILVWRARINQRRCSLHVWGKVVPVPSSTITGQNRDVSFERMKYSYEIWVLPGYLLNRVVTGEWNEAPKGQRKGVKHLSSCIQPRPWVRQLGNLRHQTHSFKHIQHCYLN